MKLLFTPVLLLALLFFNPIKSNSQIDTAFYRAFVVEFDSASGLMYMGDGGLTHGELFTIYHDVFMDDSLNTMEPIDSNLDDTILNMQHYKYQQKYRGLIVEGAQYIEHVKDGFVRVIFGKVAKDLDYSIGEILSEGSALQSFIDLEANAGNNHLYAWNDSDYENEIKCIAVDTLDDSTCVEWDSTRTFYPQGELVWMLDKYSNIGYFIPKGRYTLAYKFLITITNPRSSFYVYVDAYNGTILKMVSASCFDGPATTLYNGSRTIDTEWRGGIHWNYRLKASGSGPNIWTKKIATLTNKWRKNDELTDGDDNWGTDHQHGTTAHWAVTRSWDYFGAVHNWHGPDNKNSLIHLRTDELFPALDVNGNLITVPFPNAAWISSKNSASKEHEISVGSVGSDYLGTLDVLGHEFTHGVIEFTAQLASQDETGALNESYADIFGELIEHAILGSNNWLINGDLSSDMDIFKRSFINPKSFGNHSEEVCPRRDASYIRHPGAPHTYLRDFWEAGLCDNGGVHINASVQNHWFWLIVNGGRGVNDNSSNYDVGGIGITKAEAIVWLTLRNWLINSSQYSDSRANTIAVTRFLYGQCGNEEIQLTNAWEAVGVGAHQTCWPTGITKKEVEINKIKINTIGSNVIAISSDNESLSSVKILSIDGKLVWNSELNSDSCVIDISTLAQGLYILDIKSGVLSKRVKFIKI